MAPTVEQRMRSYGSFEENDSSRRNHNGGQQHDPAKEARVSQATVNSPQKGLRRLSLEEDVPYITCHRIVRRFLNMYPYHLQRVPASRLPDSGTRLHFPSFLTNVSLVAQLKSYKLNCDNSRLQIL